MNRSEQQQTEIYLRGISRRMSDINVEDGGCSESVNVFVDGKEIAPVLPPEIVDNLPQSLSYELLYIHKTAGYTNYIGLKDNSVIRVLSTGIYTSILSLSSGETILSIKGIGNTLIIATSFKMCYALYKDNTYRYLGEQIPQPDFSLYIEQAPTIAKSYPLEEIIKSIKEGYLYPALHPGTTRVGNECDIADNIMGGQNTKFDYLSVGESVYKPSNKELGEALSAKAWEAIIYLIRKNEREGILSYPIFIRYAVKLYDGSYIRHSVPVLLSEHASEIAHVERTGEEFRMKITLLQSMICKASLGSAELLSEWEDIVQGVDFFVSEPLYLTPQDTKFKSLTSNVFVFDSISDEKKEERLLSKSIFYRIKEISLRDLSVSREIDFSEDLKDVLGEQLLTQPKLEDDYISNHKLIPTYITEYNSRLHMMGVTQKYYDGPPSFTSTKPYTSANVGALGWYLKFYIRNTNGDEVITHKQLNAWVRTATRIYGSRISGTPLLNVFAMYLPYQWLAYPSANCYKCEIYTLVDSVMKKVTLNMRPHPLLNISYWFAGFNAGNIWEDSSSEEATLDTTTKDSIMIDNKIFQSEVNNPFLFKAGGIHTIPTSKIIGMATTTKAISQGQFGQFPLYVFCVEGIWVMQVDNSGLYQNISPLSREVCTNAQSITGTDGAIVFTSKKGVMIVQGAEIKCISEDMIGKHFRADEVGSGSLQLLEETAATNWGSELPQNISDDTSFLDFMSHAFIAYDYGNSRLIFVNEQCAYQYVYILSTNTWHKLWFDISFTRALNSYPDCYLQDSAGKVYNFSVFGDVNDYSDRVFGMIVTRGFDLGKPNIRKRIDEIKLRGDFERGMVKCLLYGSFDGIHYTYIDSIKGKSFMSYKLVLYLSLLPSERLNRITIVSTERWSNKTR